MDYAFARNVNPEPSELDDDNLLGAGFGIEYTF